MQERARLFHVVDVALQTRAGVLIDHWPDVGGERRGIADPQLLHRPYQHLHQIVGDIVLHQQQALQIENRRRIARGEEPLASLEDELLDEEALLDEDAVLATEDDAEDDTPDVLLSEAGNVLVDALLLKQQAFAIRTQKEMNNK